MSLKVHFKRVTKVRSLCGLNGVQLRPLMEPEDALTVSSVLSNARGVVMVRWARNTNPTMIKQFIYMYLQRCISTSDSKHVMSSVTIRTLQLIRRTLYARIQSKSYRVNE